MNDFTGRICRLVAAILADPRERTECRVNELIESLPGQIIYATGGYAMCIHSGE
jgi:hypothetical protein